MAHQHVSVAVRDRVATLTITRPDKLNALDDQTIAELGAAIGELHARDDVGAVLVTGAGRAFVAGADIAQLAGQGPIDGKARALRGQDVFSRFERSPKPTVAAVNGFALGGGCELALACHVRIAAEGAKFGQPEVRLGILPGYGGTQRLARLIGRGRALQLLLTGEMIDAPEAFRLGLVNKVVPSDQLIAASEAMLAQMLANGPLALAACIEAVNRGLDIPLAEGLDLEANLFGLLSGTAQMREGMQAFLTKRPPDFASAS